MRILCIVTLLLACLHGSAQETSISTTWKKYVNRTINTKKYDKTIALDSLLQEGVKDHRLIAYTDAYEPLPSSYEATWQSPAIIKDSTIPKGKEVVAKPADITDAVYQYRINEEWTFNPSLLSFDITERYVTPLMDVYGTDKIFRGKRALFDLKYKDVKKYIEGPGGQWASLDASLLLDFYSTGNGPVCIIVDSDTLHTRISMTIAVPDTGDGREHALEDVSYNDGDSMLFEQIYTHLRYHSLRAWHTPGAEPNDTLAKDEFMKLITKIDTTEVTDPITGNIAYTIVYHDFNYQMVYKYKLMMDCTTDFKKGKTQMHVTAIAPCMDVYDANGKLQETKTLFWVRDQDIKPIIDRSEQYHPDNTFALHLWNRFFVDDAKPVIER